MVSLVPLTMMTTDRQQQQQEEETPTIYNRVAPGQEWKWHTGNAALIVLWKE
jgi:hypothetical protein